MATAVLLRPHANPVPNPDETASGGGAANPPATFLSSAPHFGTEDDGCDGCDGLDFSLPRPPWRAPPPDLAPPRPPSLI